MAFHRYTAPTWYGVTPITPSSAAPTPQETGNDYFFINVGSAGSGGAPEGDQVDSGPNQYTFFVAFGEDATSLSVNRGLRALAENTDILDNVVSRDRIVPWRTPFTLALATDVIGIPQEAYLGPPGLSLTANELQRLFRVCDTQGRELYSVLDEHVVLVQSSSIATTPALNYCDTVSTLTLNSTLEPGTYHLLHYTRGSLALTQQELLRYPYLEAAASISGYLQLQLAYWRGDQLAWDAPPPATLYNLKLRGLDGIYRNDASGGAPALPADLLGYYPNPVSSDPSAGAFFLRDGASMLGFSQHNLGGTPSSSTRWIDDPMGGIWTSYVNDSNPLVSNSAFDFVGVTRGFVHVGHRIRAYSNGTMPAKAPGLAAFAAYTEHADEFSDTSLAPTKLTLPLACNLQRVSGEDRISLTSFSNWFYRSISGTDRTSLVIGLTLVEVEWANPADPITTDPKRRIYRVASIDASRINVTALDGGQAVFPATLTAGTITRIFTPTMLVPDGVGDLRAAAGSSGAEHLERGPFMALVPPLTSFSVDDSIGSAAAYVGASNATSTARALEWGGYEDRIAQAGAGTYRRLGSLRGDGSIYPANIVSPLATITTLTVTTGTVTTLNATTANVAVVNGGTVNASVLDAVAASVEVLTIHRLIRAQSSVTVSGTTAITLTALSTDQVARVEFTGGGAILSTITLPGSFLTTGREFEIVFDHTTATGQIQNMSSTWPSAFKFEKPADKLLSQVLGAIDRYVCKAVSSTVVQVSVKRTLP